MASKFTREEFELLKDILPCEEYLTTNGTRTDYLYYSGKGTRIWDRWERLLDGYLRIGSLTQEDYKVHAFLDRPLEDMPLFLNDRDWCYLAKWRLSLGK